MVRGNKFKPQGGVAAVFVAKAAAVEAEVEKKEVEVAPNKELPTKAVLVPLQQQQQKKKKKKEKKAKKPPAPSPPPPPKKHSLPTVVAAPPTPAAAGANWAAMRAAKLVGRSGVKKSGDDKRKRGDDERENGNGNASKHHKAGPLASAALDSNSHHHRPEAIDGAATRALTRVLAVDCEMVGVGPGGVRSSLARVCLVNESGSVVLDTHVAQREKVTDHRTRVSGIRPEHLDDAPDAVEVRRRVGELIQGRVLVGHAVSHDLKALMLGHPRAMLRDTARYPPLMRSPGAPGRKPKARKLRDLARQHLGLVIQEGEHSPVDDARAALYLYQLHRKTWEAALKRPGGMRELRPPMGDRKKMKKGGSGSGGSGGAQAALAKLAEQDEMVDL